MLTRSSQAMLPFYLLLTLALAGCGGSNGRIPIQGTVTYKGEMLAKGVITFIPVDAAKGSTESALIVDGQYAVPAVKGLVPGGYHVSISSVVPKGDSAAGAAGTAPGAPKGAREVLPEKYNRKSKLTIDVTTDGRRAFDFHLD